MKPSTFAFTQRGVIEVYVLEGDLANALLGFQTLGGSGVDERNAVNGFVELGNSTASLNIGYIRPVLSTTESNKVQSAATTYLAEPCAVRMVGHSLLELCPATR